MVRLIITTAFGFGSVCAERHQTLEIGARYRELEHDPAGRIPAYDVAGLKDLLE